jgi:hypothetical protein
MAKINTLLTKIPFYNTLLTHKVVTHITYQNTIINVFINCGCNVADPCIIVVYPAGIPWCKDFLQSVAKLH